MLKQVWHICSSSIISASNEARKLCEKKHALRASKKTAVKTEIRECMKSYNVSKLLEINENLVHELRQYCFDIVGCCQTVHQELGPFLNEYIYQDALNIIFKQQNIPFAKEYYFNVLFRNEVMPHKHYVDFCCKTDIFLECKAIEQLGSEQRQQLWNYMRLSKTKIGILYNFAPIQDQCERYYFDPNTQMMYAF